MNYQQLGLLLGYLETCRAARQDLDKLASATKQPKAVVETALKKCAMELMTKAALGPLAGLFLGASIPAAVSAVKGGAKPAPGTPGAPSTTGVAGPPQSVYEAELDRTQKEMDSIYRAIARNRGRQQPWFALADYQRGARTAPAPMSPYMYGGMPGMG